MKFKIRINKIFKDFVIILAISLTALIGAEIILRITFPEKIINSDKEIQKTPIAYEFNENFLVHLKPNISKVYTRAKVNGGNKITWKTNKDSFRGPNLRDSPEYRVIVYGDSNIQARFSENKKTFTGQLEYYLGESGVSNIEIINAGIVGFGPDQSLIRFENEVDRYKPNLVILHIFADNDFGDLVRNRLFSLDTNGNLVNTNYRKTVDPHLLKSEPHRYKSSISKLLIVQETEKIISRLLDQKTKKKKKKTYVKKETIDRLWERVNAEYKIYKASQPKQIGHFADHYDIDVALNPEQESSQIKIQLMGKILNRANNLALAKGIKFLVIIQPSTIDMTADNFLLGYQDLQEYPNYSRSRLSGEIEKLCVSHNIHFINFFDTFLENNPGSLYFKANDHWNDEGQKVAAIKTAQYVIDNSMLEK